MVQGLKFVMAISEREKSSVFLMANESGELFILKEVEGEERAAIFRRIQEQEIPFLPKIWEVFIEDGKTKVLEEYVEGQELSKLLTAQIQETDGFSYMEQLLQALQCMHRMQPPVIHRDIKPENILITEAGQLRLLDFDAAREWLDEGKESDTVCLGTRGYAAPEQFGFSQTDFRSDLYSAGIVCTRIAEQMALFGGRKKRLKKFLEKSTMFDPEERFQGADQMLLALKKVKDGNALQRVWNTPPGKCLVCLLFLLAAGLTFGAVNTLLRAKSAQEEAMKKEVIQGGTGQREVSQEDAGQEEPAQNIQTEKFDFDVLPDAFQRHVIHVRLTGRDKTKELQEMEDRPIPYDAEGADGFYSADQESPIGTDFPVLRFLKSNPQGLLFFDHRWESNEVTEVYLERYSPNGERLLERMYLPERDGCVIREGLLCIKVSSLRNLHEGIYYLRITARDGEKWEYYLQIHGEEEKVDNFAPRTIIPIQYYSVALENDVFFSIYNSPFGVKQVFCNEKAVPADQYLLTYDGKGVILQKDFFQNWQGDNPLELTFEMENGRKAYGRVIWIH